MRALRPCTRLACRLRVCPVRPSSQPLPAAQAAEDAVERWYNKELGPYQGLSPKRFTEETGHVTQILWKGTRRLGCGFANCNNNGVVICRYDPPGNVQDQFDANVNA